jgi:hypothetical protein
MSRNEPRIGQEKCPIIVSTRVVQQQTRNDGVSSANKRQLAGFFCRVAKEQQL